MRQLQSWWCCFLRRAWVTWQGTLQAQIAWCQCQSKPALSHFHQMSISLSLLLLALFILEGIIFLPAQLSWTICPSPYPQTFPSLPHLVPASLKPVPALQSTAGVVCHCTAVMMLLGLPQSFLARIWLISFSRKHVGPGNSFWQLVSCLQSVHLCHG